MRSRSRNNAQFERLLKIVWGVSCLKNIVTSIMQTLINA